MPAAKTAKTETAPEVPDSTTAEHLVAEKLRTYADWRLRQLNRPRSGGNPGGPAAIHAASVAQMLNELKEFAAWLDQGCPEASSVISDADKDFYREAIRRGIQVPAAIVEQL
jgi:hypothetical protein